MRAYAILSYKLLLFFTKRNLLHLCYIKCFKLLPPDQPKQLAKQKKYCKKRGDSFLFSTTLLTKEEPIIT